MSGSLKKDYVNEATGEIHTVLSPMPEKKSRYRNGWAKHYPKEFIPMLASLIGGKKGDVIAYVLESFGIDFILQVKQKSIMDKVECSKYSVDEAFRELRKVGLIKRDGKVFKVNPFAFIPYGSSNEIISKNQQEWEQI